MLGHENMCALLQVASCQLSNNPQFYFANEKNCNLLRVETPLPHGVYRPSDISLIWDFFL